MRWICVFALGLAMIIGAVYMLNIVAGLVIDLSESQPNYESVCMEICGHSCMTHCVEQLKQAR
jgi:hypothetical protein